MSNEQTKAKLIEAAGEEFAEKGFEGATVRSICRKAGANVASVNYHFGDKARLYEQALLEAHRCGMSEGGDELHEGDWETRFRGFIRTFLENVFNDPGRSWQRTLMLRELVVPTFAADFVVREGIRPRFERLRTLILEVCPDVDETRLNALCFSVVGQMLHYKVARTFSERLIGSKAFADLDLEYLVDHITGVSVAALARLAADPEAFGTARRAEVSR